MFLLVAGCGLLFPALGGAETPVISDPVGPVYVTNVLGESIGFDVTVDNDDGTFRYGWRKNGRPVLNPDGEGASFIKDVSIGNDAGTYACYVDNPLNESALSAPFYLTVLSPPVVTAQPKSQTTIAGTNVALTVGVNAALFPTNFTYRWQYEGMDLFDDGEHVFGADTPTLTLVGVVPEDEGNYSANIFNDATALSLSGEPTASAAAYLTVVVGPAISFDPEDDIETVGSAAEFSVVVDAATTDTDENPLTYQWRKNGVNISAATNPTATNDTLSISGAQSVDEGEYTVVVKNTGGAVTSAVARLMFLPDLTSVTPAADFTVTAGTNVTFSAAVSGSPPLIFQWFIDDVPIPGANASNYTFHVGSAEQEGGYSVQVSNYVCALADASPEESIPVNLTILPETNRPTLTITNPTDDGRPWTNAVISIRGTAADNGFVQAVYYQRDSDTNLYVAAGTNAWTAEFPGAPGTNTVTVYAVDWFGNQSSNATRKVFYVVPAPFTLLMAGKGTVNSNWTGPNLEIGRVYRMTMTGAGAGYRFVGWSGGVTASTTSIDFIMQSNLVIQANFTDVYSPTFAITNPPANTVFSNQPAVTVGGTVTDNSGGAEVRYRLNGGEWAAAAGTNAWSADLTLLPGTNVFNAYAVDATGNTSATNAMNLVYYLPMPLAVATTGQGAISPNYDGQNLMVGKNYSMAATGTNGHKFLNWAVSTNWVGGTISSNATLVFMMQSNLTVRATFADTNRPVVTITGPAANSRFTNTTVNVQGTLADNVSGATLFWRLGTNAWIAAATAAAAGTNLWSVPVNPQAGTNAFSAFAVDAAGNRSTTNTLSLIYAGSFAVLVVQTNGQGVLTPDYNGRSLGIGQTFTVSAVGTNGFVFFDWLSGDSAPLAFTTNQSTLTFVMRTNLTLQAVFLDAQPPVVTITNPLPAGMLADFSTAIGGTAVDNDQVVAVRFRLNQGPWTNTAGISPWAAHFRLAAGTNTVSACAVDAAGNYSLTNTIGTFVVPAPSKMDGLALGAGGGVALRFPTEFGAVYTLEYKDSLAAPVWTPLGGAVAGTGGVLSLTDTNAPAATRYYRLRVEVP